MLAQFQSIIEVVILSIVKSFLLTIKSDLMLTQECIRKDYTNDCF
jgi:hypothetical protein